MENKKMTRKGKYIIATIISTIYVYICLFKSSCPPFPLMKYALAVWLTMICYFFAEGMGNPKNYEKELSNVEFFEKFPITTILIPLAIGIFILNAIQMVAHFKSF